MSELYKNNIGTQVLYIPIFLQPYYKKKYKFKIKDFPVANDYYSRALSIPIFFDLKLSEQKYIVDKINFLTS